MDGENMKDKGYAWIVMVAVLFLNIVSVSLPTLGTVTVLTYVWIGMFPESKDVVSWAGGISGAGLYLTGPVVTVIVHRIGCHRSALIGAIFVSTGAVAGAFVSQFWPLLITYGIMQATGASLVSIASTEAISLNFEKHKHKIYPAHCASFMVGVLIGPIMTEYFYQAFPYQKASLILAGIYMGGIPFALCLWSSPCTQKNATDARCLQLPDQGSVLHTNYTVPLFDLEIKESVTAELQVHIEQSKEGQFAHPHDTQQKRYTAGEGVVNINYALDDERLHVGKFHTERGITQQINIESHKTELQDKDIIREIDHSDLQTKKQDTTCEKGGVHSDTVLGDAECSVTKLGAEQLDEQLAGDENHSTLEQEVKYHSVDASRVNLEHQERTPDSLHKHRWREELKRHVVVLKQPLTLLILLSYIILNLGEQFIFSFIIEFMVKRGTVNAEEGALGMTILGIMMVVGSLSVSTLSIFPIDRLLLHFCCTLAFGTCVIVMPFIRIKAAFYILSAIIGFMCSVYMSNEPSLCAGLGEERDMLIRLAYLYFFSGIGYLLGPVTAGILYNSVGEAEAFYTAGAVMICSSIFILPYLVKSRIIQKNGCFKITRFCDINSQT